MNRWRTHSLQSFVLPLMVGLLALRAFVPMTAVPGAHAGLSLEAAMCATVSATPGKNEPRTERIEIPGADSDRAGAAHCAECWVPLLGAPLAHLPDAAFAAPEAAAAAPRAAQVTVTLLARAQSPRAPPA